MTESTIRIEQADVDGSELSGVDLARVALHAAREAARKRGDSEARIPRHRIQRAVKRDGREPTGFAAVLQGLMAERAWTIPAAGGSVLDRWPDIAAAVSSRLPEHVQAVAFHPGSGQLDLLPDSPAYATQLRLISSRIVATVNQAVGTNAVRTIRVLAAGTAPELRTTEPALQTTAAPQALVKTREMACEGYHQALTAHQAVRPDRQVDPAIAEAIESQTRALRQLSRRAFPDPDPGDRPSPIEAARAQRRRQAAATEAAALRRARTERNRARMGGTETEE
ncbi:DciA family protein (plasmid) [Streptomyces viridosporus]